MKRPLARGGKERDTADGGDHADGHGHRHGEARREHAARQRIAQDECGERAGDHARHESKRLTVRRRRLMAMLERAPEQEGADQNDQDAACELELRGSAAIGEGAADHGEASEHEDDGKPDMGEGENGAVEEAFDTAAPPGRDDRTRARSCRGRASAHGPRRTGSRRSCARRMARGSPPAIAPSPSLMPE